MNLILIYLNLELYCPPWEQFTIAHARAVMEGKKSIIHNDMVKKVKWPRFDEISCKNLWEEYAGRPDAM